MKPGPVQDEREYCDPLDAAVARLIEHGRRHPRAADGQAPLPPYAHGKTAREQGGSST
jgi:hypothetical protein